MIAQNFINYEKLKIPAQKKITLFKHSLMTEICNDLSEMQINNGLVHESFVQSLFYSSFITVIPNVFYHFFISYDLFFNRIPSR